jgi:hypothetical protein
MNIQRRMKNTEIKIAGQVTRYASMALQASALALASERPRGRRSTTA